MEHDEQADRLERDVEDLEAKGDQVGRHIDDARSDFERKTSDVTVPGAQDEEGAAPGGTGASPEDEDGEGSG